MSYEEAETIALGQLAAQLHFDMTGEKLGLFEMPCPEAIEQAMAAARETETAVIDLINEA